MTVRRQLLLVSFLALVVFLPGLASYTLWDPWETHYGEVARRMLEDGDYARLSWQDEAFRSKPVLTFWLMAAGMKVFGVATDGGFSGELVSTARVEWAMRLPFVLLGCAGIVFLWWTLARLASRRAAWIAAGVLLTTPFYFLITRQAITDMPSCALLIASMALFALALWDDRPLPGRRPMWIVAATMLVGVGAQLVYFIRVAGGGQFPLGKHYHLPGWLPLGLLLPVLVWSLIWIWRTRTWREVYLWWFYLLNGVAVLAKGPVAPAMAGLTILGYFAVTGDWRRLRDLEIPRGAAIALLVAIPWHFAIYILDGIPWLDEYVGTHLLGRTFLGTYGDRGTFVYYVRELGIGMWPWVCLVPGTLVALLLAGRPRTIEEKTRALFVIWAIVGFAFFAFVRTKYHHYVLPVVPAFAAVLGIWLDDVWERRQPIAAMAAVALPLFMVTSIDLVARQEGLVHLFCFKYDRPFPYPGVDLSAWIAVFAVGFGAGLCALLWARRGAVLAMLAIALGFTFFGIDVFMMQVSPHWGMRALLERYYRERKIYGVDLIYQGTAPLQEDWRAGKPLEVRSVIPATLRAGDPMTVTWKLGSQGGKLGGKVVAVDAEHHRFTVAASPDEKLRSLADASSASDGRRWVAVNADRLVAWQLRWRGENFYSGGEIWNPRFDNMKTVFVDVDNNKFAAWVRPQLGSGKTYFLITEIDRVKRLRDFFGTLTPKPTMEEIDKSNNKYGMVRFTL